MSKCKTITEPARRIPVVHSYDVVIVGGGIAGVTAAIAAARNKGRVALIEKESVSGGLATLGLVAIYLPICDGMGNQVIGGLGVLASYSVRGMLEARDFGYVSSFLDVYALIALFLGIVVAASILRPH